MNAIDRNSHEVSNCIADVEKKITECVENLLKLAEKADGLDFPIHEDQRSMIL